MATPADTVAARRGLRHDLGPAVALAAVKVALHLATSWPLGFHRDELYYVAGGRRLAWGYVDHPPITPLVARAATEVFGTSVTGLRVAPALAGAGVMVVAALTARRLGGGRVASTLAALGVLVSPLYLGANTMLNTVSFDQLLGAGTVLVALILLTGGRRTWWLALGAVVGVGFEAKWTILLVVVVVGAALLTSASTRADWRRPEPWLGVAIAVALALPNLVWSAVHDWPTLDFAAHNNDDVAADNGPLLFVLKTLLYVGPQLLLLVCLGARTLAADRRLRGLAYGAAGVFVVLLAVAAKPYYLGPLFPLLYAAGAVEVERRAPTRPGLVRSVATWAVVGGLIALPFVLPAVPRSALGEGSPVNEVNPETAEMVGWPELADRVADLAHEVGADAVLTSNYGQAAAVEVFRPDAPPVVSAHNSYWDWSEPDRLDGTVVVVGYGVPTLRRLFAEVTPRAPIDTPAGVANAEDGAPVAVVSGLEVDPETAWDDLRHFE